MLCYHPIANIVDARLKRSLTFLMRGLNEVTSLQSTTNSAERFTIDTYERFLEALANGVAKYEKYTSIYYRDLKSNVVKFRDGAEGEHYRLFIVPLDDVFNFSRGRVVDMGSVIVAQRVDEMDSGVVVEDLFSMFYKFSDGTIVYADHEELSHINNKRISFVSRSLSSSILMSVNSDVIKSVNFGVFSGSQLNLRSIVCTNGVVDNACSFAMGGVDVLVYKGLDCISSSALKIFILSSGGSVTFLDSGLSVVEGGKFDLEKGVAGGGSDGYICCAANRDVLKEVTDRLRSIKK